MGRNRDSVRPARKGNQNARKHGGYSAKTLEAMRYVKAIARLVREVDC